MRRYVNVGNLADRSPIEATSSTAAGGGGQIVDAGEDLLDMDDKLGRNDSY